MAKIDPKTLLEAGVHFGHRTDKWNPKMKPFIYEARNGIHVINLNKTSEQLEKAATFLQGVAAKGGKVLFVGTKKPAQDAVKQAAANAASFYVSERWLGGMLTNLNTVRKSVARMREIDDLETSGKAKDIPKQELSALRRESAKIHRNLDGIADMAKFPDAIVIVDITREDIAVLEAKRLNIPIVAITDTNADPTHVSYPIAGNDDAIRSIKIILDTLAAAVLEGNAAAPRRSKNEKGEKGERGERSERASKDFSEEKKPEKEVAEVVS
ncbi:MAG: 30S ribosomal protein S2 [Blastochloris sp.]|nr:30S ribosomal protein S2 [Blastochloris sp.]